MAPDKLRKIHTFTGLLPLALYLVFHAWEHWPVTAGRDALFARLAGSALVPLEILFVLVPLLAHGAIGLCLARRPDPGASYASPAFRRLQAVSGAVAGLFVLWHVAFVWAPAIGRPDRASAAYDAMLAQTGTYLGAALHVLALSAVCVHLGQGLSAAWLRHQPAAPVRLVRGAAIVAGLLLWLVLLNELSAYAGGAAFL
jgi:succinate dehydrogenase / fumarate reductase cytochrome b subunit